jgi:hypothetical protein
MKEEGELEIKVSHQPSASTPAPAAVPAATAPTAPPTTTAATPPRAQQGVRAQDQDTAGSPAAEGPAIADSPTPTIEELSPAQSLVHDSDAEQHSAQPPIMSNPVFDRDASSAQTSPSQIPRSSRRSTKRCSSCTAI